VSLALYLLDPDPAPAWAPFYGVRPLCELRAGAHLVRERWETFIGAEVREIFAPAHLSGFAEPGTPPVTGRHAVSGPAVIGSATFAPRGLAPAFPAGVPVRLTCQGITVGWAVPAGVTWDGPTAQAQMVEVAGVVMHGVFDLIPALEKLLLDDVRGLLGDSDPVPEGCTLLGDASWLALHEAAIEPGVVFDVRHGPIVLDSGVEVRAGTRLEGPLWVGANSRILGGDIRISAIGPRCNVRGEVASSVFLGYANKGHDGFVGHSVIGRWANLGAGTVTSDLKNTYGTVRLDIAGKSIETGLQFLGSLVGDHVKTAIGTLLGTGTVLGAGANVFDGVRAPKFVPPFAWGGIAGTARMAKDGFLKTAARVMPRRDEDLTEAMRAVLGRVYDWATR